LKVFAVLVTNCAGRKRLLAEHGLSLFIRHDSGDILLDTGAGPLFLDNAQFMDLPVENVDFALLSHSHYDHVGGIPALSRQFSMTGIACPVYHPDDYGFPKLPALISENVSKSFSLKDNIHLIGTTGIYRGEDEDQGIKELSLIVDDTLFIGCCHSGFEKILIEAEKFAKIRTVVGGFHNFKENDGELKRSAELLKDHGVEKVVVLHCSSNRFFMHLERSGIKAKVGSVGQSFNF